jgi:hypothetical protein
MIENREVDDKIRKVLKISPRLHQAIDMESAIKQVPMYVLMERAWSAYKSTQGEPWKPVQDQGSGEIEAGLTPRQVKLVTRYAELLRSGRDPEFAKIIETMLDRSELHASKEHQGRKAG